jgi:hypothetical protein
MDDEGKSPSSSPVFKFYRKEKVEPPRPKIEILGEEAALGKHGKKFEAVPFFHC